MEHVPYPKKRCPDCGYCTDAQSYYGKGPGSEINYYVCIDDRVLDGFHNPMCGCATDAGFGCIRWENL
jgi:hypothetical protein